MHFIKKLKSKAITKAILCSVVLGILAVFLAMISEFWLLFQKPVNLYDVPRDELKGSYVTVDLNYIYGAYAYTEEYVNNSATGNITAMEYVIDANAEDYCAMLIENKALIAQANELLDQSIAYYNGEIDEITAGFTVTGVMTQMPSDSIYYYHEFFDYFSLSSEEQEIVLHLCLDVRDSSDIGFTVCFLIFALVLLAICAVLLVQAFTGKHQKQVLAKARQLNPGAPELVLEQVEQLCESQQKSKALKMDSRLIFVQLNSGCSLYTTGDLVWAYHATTTQRVNFIPVAKTHSLVLAMNDGKKLTVPMKESAVMEWLQTIQQMDLNCYLGYNDTLAAIYQKDPQELVRMRQTRLDSVQQ